MMLNPVFRRETRTTLRSWKTFIGIAVYVAISTAAAAIFISETVTSSYTGGFDPSNIMILYAILSAFQLGLVLITVPALCAGSISGERERQTLDLMLTTKMKPLSIVFGKLLSSIGVVFLIILASVPVYSVVFFFGGISFGDLFVMAFFMLTVCCFVGGIAIFLSALFKRTALSVVLMYLILGVLGLGTVIIYLFIQMAVRYVDYNLVVSPWVGIVLFAANPAVGFFSMIDLQLGQSMVSSVLNAFYSVGRINGTALWVVNHYWILNIAVNLLGAFAFMKLAARRINPLKGSKKK